MPEGGQWISSYQAVRLVRSAGINDPSILALWAENELVRTQAGTMRFDSGAGERQRDFVDPPNIPARFWHWLRRSEHSAANWDLGLFQTTVGVEYRDFFESERVHEQWCMIDVTFNALDVETRLQQAPPQGEVTSERGVLPPGSSANARRHEEYAHRAAELMRRDGINRPQAIKQMVLAAKAAGFGATEPSVGKAIREAFKLMYNSDGYVIQKDPKGSLDTR